MESIKMMHLRIRKGEVGRYVFLPGSPERSEKISKYLENPISPSCIVVDENDPSLQLERKIGRAHV